MKRYEGTCDTCGEPISLEHDDGPGNVIDIGVDGDSVFTWIRHPSGAHPDCGYYFSRVYEVLPAKQGNSL